MPIININSSTYEGGAKVNATLAQGSIANVSEDQMAALASNLANAMKNVGKNIPLKASTVEKNFQDLQKRFSLMSKHLIYRLEDQEIGLRIKAPEVDDYLPIKGSVYKSTMELTSPLPFTLQKPGITTVLDLLKKEFPKVTSSLHNKEIPKYVFSSPVPINREGKGNFFPQIEVKGQIAYVAWDSSGSRIAQGLQEQTCDILLEKNEAFCGTVLSQENLRGIEKGAGVAAHFLASKVTVIGIHIIKSLELEWLRGFIEGPPSSVRRIACEHDSEEGVLYRRSSSSKSLTTFGMLGVKGTSVLPRQRSLWDRSAVWEKLIPFCLEIVPQFSSEDNPVEEDDLEMAIETQLQKQEWTKYKN